MNILALLPEIHRRPTGGNLFNRHILDYLEETATLERRVAAGSDLGSGPAAELTLVDSLLLAPAVALPRAATGPKLLLAHYLHLFEPGRQDSPEAHRERRHLPALDGVITTSEYCRDVLLREGFTASRLLAITPGLAAPYRVLRAPRPPAPARLLTVATLLEGKGLELLLEVLETLQGLPWSWEIVGDPGLDAEFSARFHRRIAHSPIAERVRLHGAVATERVVELYDRSHVFVLPSRFETCSMASMEAMARGLPVVAFRVGGLPERLPASTSHLLADPGDPSAFAANLRLLLTDPEQAARLGSDNYQASRGFPSWKESAGRLWDFIRRRAGTGE